MNEVATKLTLLLAVACVGVRTHAQVSLTIHSGSSLAIADSMNITLSGNWNNNGTFTAGKSTVTFADTFAQSLGGVAATTFNSMTVNKPNREVTLNVNGTTLNDKLTMSAGNVLLGANSFAFGSSSSAVMGTGVGKSLVTNGTGRASRQVVGNGSFQFPVAPNSSSYNPLTIALQAGDPSETFSVKVQTSVVPSAPDNSLCVQRSWDISEATTGGNNAKLTVQFAAVEQGANFASALSSTFHFDSGINNYELAGDNQRLTGSGVDPVVVAMTNFLATEFSPYIVGASGGLPVQLASFTGRWVQGQGIRLDWRTISEVNNYGFFVHRASARDSVWSELPNIFIAGHGTTNEPHDYTFTDNTIASGSWMYKLKQVDLDGTIHFTEAIVVAGATSVGDQLESAPMEFALFQNYPNPFNPSTTIKFSVEQTDRATLNVFNILGQLVATLLDEVADAGRYYKVRFDGNRLASGMYIYRLQSGKRSELKKVLLLK